MSLSRRALHIDPCPWPAPRQTPRRDGIPPFASCPAAGRHTSCACGLGSCTLRAHSHGDSQGIPALADRSSLPAHENTSLLTPRYDPLLCTVVLGSQIEPAPTKNALAGQADLRDG